MSNPRKRRLAEYHVEARKLSDLELLDALLKATLRYAREARPGNPEVGVISARYEVYRAEMRERLRVLNQGGHPRRADRVDSFVRNLQENKEGTGDYAYHLRIQRIFYHNLRNAANECFKEGYGDMTLNETIEAIDKVFPQPGGNDET